MLKFNSDWTLFLDRDGVINRRLPGRYVRSVDEFEFLPNVPNAMAVFTRIFGRVIVVTNQQGIGKGLMTEQDLEVIHRHMFSEIEAFGGQIEAVYFCPDLRDAPFSCRKPEPVMALWARRDFPEIRFEKSVMVGDSLSDMVFGRTLGMQTIFVETNQEEVAKVLEQESADKRFRIDLKVSGLFELAEMIRS